MSRAIRTSASSPKSAEGETLSLTGIGIGTLVLTADGELPVEFLQPGDRVITRDAGLRVLRGISARVAENIEVIRVGADTLGDARPDRDLLLTPTHPVLVRDWRARALTGAASALVEAMRLVDGEFIRRERVAQTRLFDLQFDAVHVIYANGVECVSGPALVPASA